MDKYSKWTWQERTTEEEEEAIANFNEALKENPNSDEVDWIREADEKCLLVETTACFPKRPNKEEHEHYTSNDWKLSKCLVAIRQMRIQALALADGEQITQLTIDRTKKRVVKTEERGGQPSHRGTVRKYLESSKERRSKQANHRMHGGNTNLGLTP